MRVNMLTTLEALQESIDKIENPDLRHVLRTLLEIEMSRVRTEKLATQAWNVLVWTLKTLGPYGAVLAAIILGK